VSIANTLKELRNAVTALRRDAKHLLCDSFYCNPRELTASRAVYLTLTPELRLLANYRFYSALHRAGHIWSAQLAYLRTKQRFGCDLHPASNIAPGLRIVHAQDVVVGPEVQLGRDVVLFNGITLGNKLGRTNFLGMPVVGDGVMVGAGAKLLGPIRVGTNSRIGANSVVLSDIPDGGIAVGAPARVIRTDREHTSKQPS
jgi:serine O-acetyltransferase